MRNKIKTINSINSVTYENKNIGMSIAIVALNKQGGLCF